MTKQEHKLTTIDPVWSKIQHDAREMVDNEPLMASVAPVNFKS